MFRILLKKEVYGNLLDLKFQLYAVVCVVLILASFFIQSIVYTEQQAHYTAREAPPKYSEQDLQRTGYKRFAQWGLWYVLEPARLQVWSRGVTGAQATAVNISVHKRLPFLYQGLEHYPVKDLQLPFDFALIVSFVLSLMVIIFSFGAVAREREEGTLKLLFSYPVSRFQVIAAKVAGGYTGLLIPLVFTFGGVLLMANLMPGFSLQGDALTGTILIFIAAALYLLLMYLIGVLVSVLCRTSVTAITFLTVIWLVFIIILHNGVLFTIKRVNKTNTIAMTQVTFDNQWNDLKNDITAKTEQRYGTTQWLFENWLKPPEEMTHVQLNEIFKEYISRLNRLRNDHMTTYINNLERENRMLGLASYFSPSLLFTNLVSRIANTGVDGRIRQYRNIIRANNDLKNFILKDIDAMEAEGLDYGDGGWKHWIPLKDLKQLDNKQPALRNLVQEAVWQFGVQIMMAVLVLMVAVYVFVKRDIE